MKIISWNVNGAALVVGSLGTYSRTSEVIATAAAFFDAYNNMVQSVRNYKAQDVKGGLADKAVHHSFEGND